MVTTTQLKIPASPASELRQLGGPGKKALDVRHPALQRKGIRAGAPFVGLASVALPVYNLRSR